MVLQHDKGKRKRKRKITCGGQGGGGIPSNFPGPPSQAAFYRGFLRFDPSQSRPKAVPQPSHGIADGEFVVAILEGAEIDFFADALCPAGLSPHARISDSTADPRRTFRCSGIVPQSSRRFASWPLAPQTRRAKST